MTIQEKEQKQLIREFDSAVSEKNYQKRKGFMDKLKESLDDL